MKVALLLLSFFMCSCSNHDRYYDTSPKRLNPDQGLFFKGLELYSFKKDDVMQYALVPGTNRNKIAKEINEWLMPLEEVIQAIGKINDGESIYWNTTSIEGIMLIYPDKKTVDRIKSLCDKRGIHIVMRDE
ncbi:MAG: hypothetical protein GF384_02990 [Elusimicrobia bacterium]|nr:hypothetical protein [Elusimicrobiota bacterium]